MKNKSNLVIIGSLLLLATLSCSLLKRGTEKPGSNSQKDASNKTLTDKTIDTVVGDDKTGIPECDEVMDLIQAEANNPDDDFVTKAAKALIFNRIKQAIKDA